MKTIEYHGMVKRVLAGRAEVEILNVPLGEARVPDEQIGRIVSVNCPGRGLRSGDRVVLTETVIELGQVILFGLYLPVLMCAAIFFTFRQVSGGDDRLALTVAAVFLFPYYSILLLMLKYFRKEHAYRLKQ